MVRFTSRGHARLRKAGGCRGWDRALWKSEAGLLTASNDLGDHDVVPRAELDLPVVDPLELGEELLEHHLVGFVTDLLLASHRAPVTCQAWAQILKHR